MNNDTVLNAIGLVLLGLEGWLVNLLAVTLRAASTAGLIVLGKIGSGTVAVWVSVEWGEWVETANVDVH